MMPASDLQNELREPCGIFSEYLLYWISLAVASWIGLNV